MLYCNVEDCLKCVNNNKDFIENFYATLVMVVLCAKMFKKFTKFVSKSREDLTC